MVVIVCEFHCNVPGTSSATLYRCYTAEDVSVEDSMSVNLFSF